MLDKKTEFNSADYLRGISREEKEHRILVLQEIEKKLAKEGEHKALSHPERACQFMPFAALKGYDEMIQKQEAKTASLYQ